MTHYGVTTDYEYGTDHKRDRIVVWSGPFYSVYEGEGYSLPNDDGYMITTYNNDKVRVMCPTPRTGDNYEIVDSAIQEALDKHYKDHPTFSVLSRE